MLGARPIMIVIARDVEQGGYVHLRKKIVITAINDIIF